MLLLLWFLPLPLQSPWSVAEKKCKAANKQKYEVLQNGETTEQSVERKTLPMLFLFLLLSSVWSGWNCMIKSYKMPKI